MLALARMDADNVLRWLDVDRQRSNDAMMSAWDSVSYVLIRADFERKQKSENQILKDRLEAEANARAVEGCKHFTGYASKALTSIPKVNSA